MNSKQIKELRKRIKPLQVEWLQSILPEDQGKIITVSNVADLLPEQTHIFGKGQLRLSFMSDKWILKILKQYPDIITYQELSDINKQEQEK